MTATVVECRRLLKRFDAVRAVDGVDLDVIAGEVLALLGPSGCGKTTTLRLVAGFERPDGGSIRISGREVATDRVFVPAERRRVGVVFQEYALFPHLTVRSNIGYGLRERRERDTRVDEMLDLVGLGGLGERKPHELSGGQQQRVALARALAPRPDLVLLDEPFSNLDAALRARVRAEVRTILREAGATAVVVTHDQEEALSLADRVAVMRAGALLQVDSPERIYREPSEFFVATFVGDAAVLRGHVNGNGTRVHTPVGDVTVREPLRSGEYDVVLRPEHVRIETDPAGELVVREVEFFGHDQLVTVALPSGSVVRARLDASQHLAHGARVSVHVTGPVHAFPVSARVE
jgi:iron(III) transport system ATP-binding protein